MQGTAHDVRRQWQPTTAQCGKHPLRTRRPLPPRAFCPRDDSGRSLARFNAGPPSEAPPGCGKAPLLAAAAASIVLITSAGGYAMGARCARQSGIAAACWLPGRLTGKAGLQRFSTWREG